MRAGPASGYLLACVLIGLSEYPLRADIETASSDEQLLKAAGIATDGPALLAFFRQRTLIEAERDRIPALIQQLGQGLPEVREKAAGELVALGTTAIPWLRQAAKDPDEGEIMSRARRCLEAIENPALVAAAARVVAQRKPAGAVEVLLTYLPFADDENVVEEVQNTLSAAARQNGQPDLALVAALADKVPARRSAAAIALSQAGHGPTIALVRKLLQDPKPTVRLQVALALGALHDADAIPVLITLVGELPQSQGRLAEDYLIALAGEQAPPVSLGTNAASRKKCQGAWTAWWNGVEAGSLLDYFRRRTLSESERAKIQGLIRHLGDNSFEVREKATTDLIALGGSAISLLRQALKSADVEIAKRAEDCLQHVAKNADGGSPILAARLLAFRKPAGAAEVLLGYLPLAEDDSVTEALQEALDATAAPAGKIDPALLRALEDKAASKRAAAVQAVCHAGDELPAARKLLHDADAQVRLRAAQALAALEDHEAVRTLLTLLTELPAVQSWQAEETLLRLAGDKRPTAEGGSDDARQKTQNAWTAWWNANEATADWSRLRGAPRTLGYTLMVQSDFNNVTGRVTELGANGKPRWEITNLRLPVDAQVLSGNRVLIAEHHGQQVTERDLKGAVLWRRQINMPTNCQRLANGNTFIACRNQLLEVDRNNKEVFTYQRPAHDIMSACKLRDGQFLVQTNSGVCLRLDAAGKEIRSFMAGQALYGGLEPMPNGRILISQYFNNRLVEYDAEGKIVWEAPFNNPSSACRLPNGHTLVASQNTQRICEIDRDGKVVWEQRTEARPLRARRR